ncbi:MAG: poly-gamma-glutamate biosynthesis protein PgsC [Candidatus Krumholzibacteria bacterium]|jgi:poly-gamma-glutamate biosynthesis protein PgsC/CapC|nr:poly-gamma-glutamate biosynthesis protein PgsC [Candidatus Krumholzibacteria bacterium]MDP6669557.1 poly-gamma-glutamate biosynthesis protein PgsC [Candidatus Krumholzibacteria bacterium]MDP6797451.1 poly-gamma-glutamate biosynthesis protein PgsC [Candidatus Krumholzibacteria bacterium]MDP7022297.1 poly-gamma-glutamate biosynthesis protein PgsC [Candidatus Krumholzibacteria bacterium]
MIYQSIGLGLVVSLIFSEVLGLAAGGLIVPGYFALYLDQPLRLLGTVFASLLTFASVQLLSRFILLYGRRTLVFCVLLGFLFGGATRYLLILNTMLGGALDLSVLQSIGYIIPGLLAYWMFRQGVLETLSTLLVASFLVRLALIIAQGGGALELAF